MIFHGRSLFILLSVIAGIESFTTNPTTTISRCPTFTYNNNVASSSSCTPKYRLSSSLAESAESIGEATAKAEEGESSSAGEEKKNEVEDISKIAYVVNLSYDTPGYKLRELFNEHGDVQKLFIPKEKGTGKSKGIAFVTLTSEKERDLTIEKLNGSDLDGRTIYVDKAKPRSEKGTKVSPMNKKLYVGNISYETTKEELREFFGQFGDVVDVYIPVDQETQYPRGFAFVTFKTEDAEKAIEGANGADLQGRTIDVKESLPRGQRVSTREERKAAVETKLYVGNLSFDTDEDTLRTVFEEFGDLIDVYQPLDRYSGRPRGFAFVTMAPEGAANAIEAIDGLELDGRIVRVNEAQPKGYSPPPKYDDDDEDWGEDGDWNEAE